MFRCMSAYRSAYTVKYRLPEPKRRSQPTIISLCDPKVCNKLRGYINAFQGIGATLEGSIDIGDPWPQHFAQYVSRSDALRAFLRKAR